MTIDIGNIILINGNVIFAYTQGYEGATNFCTELQTLRLGQPMFNVSYVPYILDTVIYNLTLAC